MMKKWSMALVVLLLAAGLAACGSDHKMKQSDEEKVEPKTGENQAASEVESGEADPEEQEDPWTYYEEAKHEETWNDLKFKIEKVAVSDEMPGMDDEGNEVIKSAVGVKFIIENTSADKVYSTYPDQATLVTSTGEQVDADMLFSDSLGGEIHEGVIKDGGVYFYLERGAASEISWIKLNWNSSYEDPAGNYDNDEYHEHSVKIDLK
ncbi:hypothetical protein ACFFIY_04700 [Bhargavaea ullalensis]|uniref:Small lipoprotein YifL n=1 Tax=Bhargavaea ullalensis TaxID=1265685 RepID=A0ABV2G9W8_9BACL